MKYIKTFENKKYHYGRDYRLTDRNLFHYDIEILKKNNITYNLYFYKDKKLGVFFKLYSFGELSKEEKKLLKSRDFMVTDNNYEFTWQWEKFDNEEDIPLLIQASKYNI